MRIDDENRRDTDREGGQPRAASFLVMALCGGLVACDLAFEGDDGEPTLLLDRVVGASAETPAVVAIQASGAPRLLLRGEDGTLGIGGESGCATLCLATTSVDGFYEITANASGARPRLHAILLTPSDGFSPPRLDEAWTCVRSDEASPPATPTIPMGCTGLSIALQGSLSLVEEAEPLPAPDDDGVPGTTETTTTTDSTTTTTDSTTTTGTMTTTDGGATDPDEMTGTSTTGGGGG